MVNNKQHCLLLIFLLTFSIILGLSNYYYFLLLIIPIFYFRYFNLKYLFALFCLALSLVLVLYIVCLRDYNFLSYIDNTWIKKSINNYLDKFYKPAAINSINTFVFNNQHDKDFIDAAKDLNIYYFISISGLHFSLLAMLCKKITRNKMYGKIVIFSILLFYAYIIG